MRHIPNWHKCEFSDTTLSYTLSILLSSDERRNLGFHFDYSIDVNNSEIGRMQSGRSIMFCPHVDAHARFINNTDFLPSLDCTLCGILTTIRVWQVHNVSKYSIQFVRKFHDPRQQQPKDMNWRRQPRDIDLLLQPTDINWRVALPNDYDWRLYPHLRDSCSSGNG
jgi:hypothetical protein